MNLGLTVNDLSTRTNNSVIRGIVQEQSKLIDAKILYAHDHGLRHIEHDLPTVFNINNMTRTDAQTMIYSELIALYSDQPPDGKGFAEVYIDNKPALYVYWHNGMDADEKKRRMELIKRHMRPGTR